MNTPKDSFGRSSNDALSLPALKGEVSRVKTMIFPLLIFTLITSFFQGELQFPWEMNVDEKLVIFFLSLAITLIAWGISLENLGINNLNKLLRD